MAKQGTNTILHGAAAFNHRLKEYGGGQSMQAGLNRIVTETAQKYQKQGISIALKRANILERLLGHQIMKW